MKKYAIFTLIVIFTFLFVACNKTSTNPSTTDSSAETMITTNPVVTTEATTNIDLAEYELRSGLFNFRDEREDFKNIYLEAMDDYLFENLYAGVPLYSEYINGFLYSDRVNLPLNEFDSELMYGEEFGSLKTDDSYHIMYDGDYGNEGEYTLRMQVNSFGIIKSLNNQTVSGSRDFYKLINMSGYEREVIEGNAVEVDGLLDGDPVPSNLNPEMTNVLTAYTWKFEVKEGLTWFYHPDMDVSSLDEGHEILDANDFVESYKLALKLDNRLGRLLEDLKIVNADNYIMNPTEVTWETVGISLIDDFTFSITFDQCYSLIEVKDIFRNPMVSPLNIELYDYLEGDYGTSPDKVAYSGNYYVDTMYIGDFYSLKRVPSRNGVYDGYEIYTNTNTAETHELYEQEKLDIIYTIYDYDDSADNYPDFTYMLDRKYKIDYAIGFNAFPTDELYQEQYPSSSFEIEPIVSNLNFRKALYTAINREDLVGLIGGYNEPKTGYNNEDVLDGLSDTYGFNVELARQYFHLALLEMGDDYDEGERIVLEVWDELKIFDLLETELEEILYDEELDIGIDLVKINPYNYADVVNKNFAFVNNWLLNKLINLQYDLIFTSIDFKNIGDIGNHLFLFNGFPFDKVEVPVQYDVFRFNENSELVDSLSIKEAWSFRALSLILDSPRRSLIIDGKLNEEMMVKVTQMTPFSIQLDINGLSSEYIENLSWELMFPYIGFERWDDLEYTSLENGIVTFNGLLPSYYAIDISYKIIYEDDYDEFSNFQAAIRIPYIMNPSFIENVLVNGDTAEIYLYTIDRDRVFEEGSIVVYQGVFREENIIECSIEYIGDMAIITGLLSDTTYYFTFMTDDDFSEYAEEDVNLVLKSFIIT